jgi:hypothetical protein
VNPLNPITEKVLELIGILCDFEPLCENYLVFSWLKVPPIGVISVYLCTSAVAISR